MHSSLIFVWLLNCSYHGPSSTVEAAAEPGQQQLTAEMTDNISRQEVDNSSSTPEIAESDQLKDTAVPHMPQDSAQNTYSAYALATFSKNKGLFHSSTEP